MLACDSHDYWVARVDDLRNFKITITKNSIQQSNLRTQTLKHIMCEQSIQNVV